MKDRRREADGFGPGFPGAPGSGGPGRAGGAGDAWGAGGSGGPGRFFARVFENPDNPLGWSLKIFTVWGIAVRVHLMTILFVVFMLLWSIPASHAGIGFMSLSMGSLLGLVLLHEFGHCFACRLVGGEADRIVMLPIGGLALVRPPDDWRSNFITTAGGPLVNVAIVPVTSLALWAAGLGAHVVFNPLDPMSAIRDPAFGAGSTLAAYARVGLWWVHYINLVLLAFNVLVPAFPLDGGRLLQALLWRHMGYRRATELTVTLGLLAAMAMGVFGLVVDESMLVVIAGLSGWACWVERRRLRSPDEVGAEVAALGSGVGAPRGDDLDEPPDDPDQRRRARLEETIAREQAEVDRILEKISASGIDSLTRAERKTLKTATERRKREQD